MIREEQIKQDQESIYQGGFEPTVNKGDKLIMGKVFDNEVYEQQRLNIERMAKENPDDWFFKSEMKREPSERTGFAPRNRICYNCHKDITSGEHGITLERLGNYIITGCPHCNRSYCD